MTEKKQLSPHNNKLPDGQPTNHGTISSRAQESFILQGVLAASETYHSPCQWLTSAVSPTVNWHVRDADHSLLYNTEEKV